MINSKSIGNKITEARKRKQLTQAELSKRVSISPQAVGKWERGESMPDIVTLDRLAGILEVDLNYFSSNHKSDMENLEFTPMPNTPIKKSILIGGDDWNWDMSEGNWSDGDFSGLKNLKEKFNSSNVKNCQFVNAKLDGLLLAKNNIELCDFSDADLRDSRIQSSNFLNNKFLNCSLIDTIIFKSNIEKCDFSSADFSGAEFVESNLEKLTLNETVWKFTKFNNSNLSHLTFTGTLDDCHFEACSFYHVRFENVTIRNSFFKYNKRFKKVEFVNCKVDTITYAFLKNNQANLTGVTLLT